MVLVGGIRAFLIDGNFAMGLDFWLDSVAGISTSALHLVGFCFVLDKVVKVVNI